MSTGCQKATNTDRQEKRQADRQNDRNGRAALVILSLVLPYCHRDVDEGLDF